ncbi:MAG: hypothetical protein K8R21_13685 [Leptospira sp.]|nr:hypothetical protein [Leptospira sp.]
MEHNTPSEVFHHITDATRLKLARIPFQAIETLKKINAGHLLFSTDGGQSLKPYLRRIAADFQLYLLSLDEPGVFQARFIKNKRGGHCYVELNFQNFLLTTSYVRNLNQLPRRALYRQRLIEANPMLPFSDLIEVKQLDSIYVMLTYGETDLIIDFVNLKFPLREGGHQTFDLMSSVSLDEVENRPSEEYTDKEIQLRLKDFTQKIQKAE